MQKRRIATAGASMLAVLLTFGAAGATAAPPYPVTYTGDFSQQASQPDSPPLGANDFDCNPSAAHPRPVVLVHGLLANQTVNWPTISPLLANDGYCVFTLTYGTDPDFSTPFYQPGGMIRMEDSAEQLSDFVDQVLAATGAAKVDIVGHSEGSLMPNYYVRYLGGAAKVERYVGLTTIWAGTDPAGLATAHNLATSFGGGPVYQPTIEMYCLSCFQFLDDSDFIAEMNAGGVAHPDVTYTNIVTRYDELVVPYTSGLMAPGPNVTNFVLQDGCEIDLAEHLAVAWDPRATAYVTNALDPAHPRPVPCEVVLPGLGAPQARAPAPLDSDSDGTPDFADACSLDAAPGSANGCGPGGPGGQAGAAAAGSNPFNLRRALRKCGRIKRRGKRQRCKRRARARARAAAVPA